MPFDIFLSVKITPVLTFSFMSFLRFLLHVKNSLGLIRGPFWPCIFSCYGESVLCSRAAQCIDKEILISKNGNIDIDIEIDKRML